MQATETTSLLRKKLSSFPPIQDVLVCTLTYVLALLFVVSPLREVFGDARSKHLVTTTTVWFHPIRPRGNLIEVLMYTLKLLMLAVALCFGATGLVQFIGYLDLPHSVEVFVLTLWLSAALGLIGFLKMWTNNASFNTASSAAIIFLVSVLLKEDDAQYGYLPISTMLHYLEMVGTGAFISGFVSFTCYRKTSLEFIETKTAELELSHTQMVRDLVRICGEAIPPELLKSKSDGDALLASLKQQAQYAQYERMFVRDQSKYSDALRKVRAMEKQEMLIGGMIHCVSTFRKLQIEQGFDLSSLDSTAHTKIEELRPAMSRLAEALEQYAKRQIPSDVLQVEMNNYLAARNKLASPDPGDISEQSIISHANLTREEDSRIIDKIVELPLGESNPDSSRYVNAGNTTDESTDRQAEATCSLFAHHLQDFAAGYCDPDYRRSLGDTNSGPRNSNNDSHRSSWSPEPSYKLEEALYTKKTTHAGLGPRLWKILRVLRSRNALHGLRVGLGAMILSLPAYLPSTRDGFQRWHGEWAVITFMIIMARNLGAMSHNIPLRLIGTTVGAAIGIIASLLFSGWWLILVSAFVCSICYRRILSKENPVFGRFILLSYNLVSLYGFSMPTNNDNIYDIAFHRVVSVTIGVLWAVFITVTIWPHSARQELRSKLCIQWMRMGMTWKNDLLAVDNGKFTGIPGDRELQTMMFKLEALLKICPYEVRLRGNFDPVPYKLLLESTQIILDAFHSLSTLIKDEPHASAGELELLGQTQATRAELCHLLFLQFFTASTAVRLGFPVPEFIPRPDSALRKLAKALRKAEMDGSDFVLFFTYMTVVRTLSSELKQVHASLRQLFGTLDNDILFAYV